MSVKQYLTISIPVRVLAKNLGKGKSNSIFYTGLDIASVKCFNYEYILTTRGEYDFVVDGVRYNDMWERIRQYAVKELTDQKIKDISDNDCMSAWSAWGWFEIIRYDNGSYDGNIGECYTTYEEAMDRFIKLVGADIQNEVKK